MAFVAKLFVHISGPKAVKVQTHALFSQKNYSNQGSAGGAWLNTISNLRRPSCQKGVQHYKYIG